MKVAVECKSILLQKALEKFFGKHLCALKQCDIVVRDYKSNEPHSFYIGSEREADLIKPFSRSQLLLALENKYKELGKNSDEKPKQQFADDQNQNFEILQKRIEMLTQEYQKNILEAIKAFYG